MGLYRKILFYFIFDAINANLVYLWKLDLKEEFLLIIAILLKLPPIIFLFLGRCFLLIKG